MISLYYSKTRIVFEKLSSNINNVINKIVLFLNFTQLLKKLVQIGLLLTYIKNVENVCSILLNISLFEKYVRTI